MFKDLYNNRKQARQAQQIAIYGIKKDGTRYAAPLAYADADRVADQIAYMEKLNPGKKYVAA